jgi:hypothetical protein
LEELKLDGETAQMEVEELRMEMEDSKAAANSNDAHNMAQSLSIFRH